MKKYKSLKIVLSVILSLTLLFLSTVSGLAKSDNYVDYSDVFENENLFENGNFEKTQNGVPVGWTVCDEKSAASFDVSISGKTPDNNNALTLKATKDFSDDVHAGRYFLWNNRAIIIKRNTTYTFSFYIKSDISQVRVYLYEPRYESKSGVAYREDPAEGINIYTYDSDLGFTRVSRTDIQHVKSLSNGTALAGNNSMSVLETTDGWIKLTHTFTTGDLPEHEAKVRYGLLIPGAKQGKTVSVGSFMAVGEQKQVENTYAPSVNNGSYGWVEPVSVTDGKEVVLKATPADGRVFEGWYKNGSFVSAEKELVFTWDDDIPEPGYKAYFGAGSNHNLIDFCGFEDYQNMEMITERFGRQNNNWVLAAADGVSFENVYASSLRAHGGTKSVRVNAGGSYVGYTVSGLAPECEYAFSAYAWLPAPSTAKIFKLEEVLVLSKDQAVFKDGTVAYTDSDLLASQQDVLTGNDNWQRFAIRFKTDRNGSAVIWMKHTTQCYMYLDDISVFKPVSVEVESAWGGTVSATPGGLIVKDTEVEFIAKPYDGNFFVAWKNGGSNYSEQAEFTKTISDDIKIKAYFDGFNTTTEDLFTQRGWDGTFENGTVPGWYATHKNALDAASVSHCTYSVSSRHAYRGQSSLRVSAYHRSSILPLTGLKENTDYRLSFYYLYEDNGEQTAGGSGFAQNAVVGKDDVDISTADIVYDEIGYVGIIPNSGWHKADFYFNTGNSTAVNYLMYYGTNDYATGCVFFDNMTLTEYTPSIEIKNSDFSETVWAGGRTLAKEWITAASPVTDEANISLALNQGDTAFQILKLEKDSLYTVTFKGKGNIGAAAVDLLGRSTSVTDRLSSVAYTDCNSDRFKECSFSFYSGSHKAVKLMFEGLADGSQLDDITVTKAPLSAGGIVEKIDFESERFCFASDSDNNFSLYHKQSASDNNVLSGNGSLKLTPGDDAVKNSFLEAYMGFRSVTGVSYTVSVNYKSASGGEIYISPDMAERYCIEQGFTYCLKNGWQTAEFHFITLDDFNIKTLLAAVADSTKGDVYFDDIVIKARMPLIDEYNLEKTYCDDLYNIIEHQSFENFSENSNWGKLPDGFTVHADNHAAASTHVMTVKSGSKKIFAFEAKPGTVYEFGVSLRGYENTKGSVSVTVDAAGKYCYTDTNDVARSVITASNDGNWKRDAFSFSTLSTGIIYVTIECSSGTMDLDNVMLFEKKYATLVDNNDYVGRRNYDYNNPIYVLFKDIMASLGDFFSPVVIVSIMLAAAVVLVGTLFWKKGKEDHNAK